MRKALVVSGIVCSTIVVPVLAIVLLVSFVKSLVSGPMWSWWFWACGAVVIVLLHIAGRIVIRIAEKLDNKST